MIDSYLQHEAPKVYIQTDSWRMLEVILIAQEEFTVQISLTREAQLAAVAVIADRTAYDIRYIGKLSNRFRLQVYERLVYARSFQFRSDSAHKLNPLKRD